MPAHTILVPQSETERLQCVPKIFGSTWATCPQDSAAWGSGVREEAGRVCSQESSEAHRG